MPLVEMFLYALVVQRYLCCKEENMRIISSQVLRAQLEKYIGEDTSLLSLLDDAKLESVYTYVTMNACLTYFLCIARTLIVMAKAGLVDKDQAFKVIYTTDMSQWIKIEQRFYPYIVANCSDDAREVARC